MSKHAHAFVHESSGPLFVTGPTFPADVALRGTVMKFRRNEEIFGQGEPADYVHKVLDGVVRRYTLLCDGRRQVRGFYFRGEIFGLERGEKYCSSAESVTGSITMAAARSRLLERAERNGHVARWLWSMTACELERSEEHALLLIKSARERVAVFLVDMAKRLAEDTIDLRVSRQDIADHLGLTIETVSRILTQFSEERVIELAGSRQIALRGLPVLSELGKKSGSDDGSLDPLHGLNYGSHSNGTQKSHTAARSGQFEHCFR
jgi:CRP/FNR family nitrogen fixation transcriptional regulator